MSCYLIKVENGHKVARSITSEEEYKQLRGSNEQKANLRLARAGNDAAKRRLVQFNYSGHYPQGVVKGMKLPSGAFGFDMDEPEAFAKAAKLLLKEPDKYGLLMLERSARQGGHAVFEREKGKTILENQVRIATMLKCEMDTSAHDINRVYFTTTSDDEDLLFLSPRLFKDEYDEAAVAAEGKVLEERERYGQEELPEGAHKANKHYEPWKEEFKKDSQGVFKGQEFKNSRNSTSAASASTASASAASTSAAAASSASTTSAAQDNYLGIPYGEIIKKWWQMYNDGQEPMRSNRNTLTFELAVNLRHICGFDRNQLAQIIPCYDGFPEQEKMACINSALNEKITQMPKRLKDVLSAIRQERMKQGNAGGGSAADNEALVNALDEANAKDDLFYYNALPKLPQGIRDSISAVGPALALPVITAICPAIGMLATGVKVSVHGKMNSLNLISYIAGDFASGKGSIDPVIDAWTSEVKEMDKMYQQKEDEWRAKKRAAKNKKEQPEEPKLPVRCLTLNNTVANLAERLANTEGKHAFSFTPEADTVAQKWKSAMSDFSVMLRQAYDGTSYEREARSADAVNVHIDRLLWNVVMCGTPDALYRVVSNYTDGFQSRIIVAKTPDNTFTPLSDNMHVMNERQRDRIIQIAHLLPLLTGEVVLPKLEDKGREWLEQIRLETMKNDDKVKARQRFRICPTTMRMMTCIMLCKVLETLIQKHGFNGAEKQLKESPDLWKGMLVKTQTPAMLNVFDVLADYQLDNALYFFRSRIEEAFSSKNYCSQSPYDRTHRGKNDSIFERLDVTFTFEQAEQQSVAVKGATATHETVRQMLKNWKRQGLISILPDKRYQKVTSII
ncbi:YfjI family protein [Segatella copri]|uniref:YfjI family protein n=1 Tax=Segatella copri TaxID=165179 RepID=A0AAW5TX28_9BACT|nr:YfjI family protein [Segatella copri]MCW4077062.1 YfjI family protein [Segatella copri]MCW4093051.1 YfjI family protein [Segatella copri]MCW4108147.1 YfjI family protein [Segatella copri]